MPSRLPNEHASKFKLRCCTWRLRGNPNQILDAKAHELMMYDRTVTSTPQGLLQSPGLVDVAFCGFRIHARSGPRSTHPPAAPHHEKHNKCYTPHASALIPPHGIDNASGLPEGTAGLPPTPDIAPAKYVSSPDRSRYDSAKPRKLHDTLAHHDINTPPRHSCHNTHPKHYRA